MENFKTPGQAIPDYPRGHEGGYKMKRQKRCTWSIDEWEEYYETSCGATFTLVEGTLASNDIYFCCYCGKYIKEVVK